jgi:hypothetical protein
METVKGKSGRQLGKKVGFGAAFGQFRFLQEKEIRRTEFGI